MRLPISKITIGPRHRTDMGDIDSLAHSMTKLGLLHPVVVDMSHQLIAGARRLAAAKQLGWTDVLVTIIDIERLVDGEYAENECRKDFTPSERVAIGREIEELIGDRRGSNQHATKELPQDVGEAPGMETAQIAAKRAGFRNVETYRQAKCAFEHGAPELHAALDAGAVSISAAKVLATLPPEQQAEVAAQGPRAMRTKARELREAEKQRRTSQRKADELEDDTRRAEAKRAVADLAELLIKACGPGKLSTVLTMVEKIREHGKGQGSWYELEDHLREANGGPWDVEPFDESPLAPTLDAEAALG
jgi:ParB family chromosome partitioning protein